MSIFDARKARDTVAKLIYDHIFRFIVFRINELSNNPDVNQTEAKEVNATVDILDIAGFGEYIL